MIVGVDTGGTFTDFVILSRGKIVVHKILSTPDNPARAVIEGLRALKREGELSGVTYGTTVATNALLERKGAKVTLVTTRGFEDLIEIGRQTRLELYELEPRKVEPLIPRSLRIGITERLSADGRVLVPLKESDLAKAKILIRKKGAGAVALCFLHSYRNPSHEKMAAKRLRSLRLPLSVSHEVLGEYREYERFSTTIANAYVAPVIANHIKDLERVLKNVTRRLSGGFRVMQSNGGTMTARAASENAVRTLLSGPAGGVVGAYGVVQRCGIRKMISFDMGGTSTDVCLADGKIPLTPEKMVAGTPVKVPMVDIHTVGAGGGSIARQDVGGALKVGPESAGANPGPVCYGKGDDITVTDANLILGRLNQDRFLGGRMRLDLNRTKKKFRPFARAIGMKALTVAWGIIRVVNSNMERAIRAVSVEKGFDPKEFTLVAFGGAGGLHAAELADGLGMPRVLIPGRPGLLSAWGLLQTPLAKDFSLSVLKKDPDFRWTDRELSSLAQRGLREMKSEGIERKEARVLRSVDMRYAGQAYEITVPWGWNFIRRFHQMHEVRFGHCDADEEVEVVNLRVRIEGKKSVPKSRPARSKRGNGSQALLDRNDIYFPDRFIRCSSYERERLVPGDRIRGPAVIYEFSSTVIVPPSWQTTVDGYNNLHLIRR
ncbi:MAG: hydantoinase/oxoprolinase family protein [Candidatus Binatia bacterium]|nr:hydantoinase/oxoprolinase family protein [Candidatus Binatia bacterium]